MKTSSAAAPRSPSSPPGEPSFALGVDYGTNSVRALIVDLADGREIAVATADYASGQAGILLDPKDPNVARQNPADYLDGFVRSVGAAVREARRHREFRPERIRGIGVDTTGSTPLPVARDGTPLAMIPEFRNDLAAQAWLWKDHTAHAEAAEITAKACQESVDYLARCGGAYSSEWYWSKILHCKRTSPRVFDAAYSWVELADFVPAWLTGNPDPERLPRSVCAAGHKALYDARWGGLPDPEFLRRLDPALVPLRRRWDHPAVPSNHKAGGLAEAVAGRVGLPPGIAVAVGAFDAHMGAVGAGVKPGTLVKILGTSTCDIMVAPADAPPADIPGLCGLVPDSVLPGMIGLEAGQSAVGDIFAWFVGMFPALGPKRRGTPHEELAREAAKLLPGESGLLALDWNNGNRTVLVDPLLTGLLLGQTLHTTAGEIYRALIEATAFGALAIIGRLEQYGVPVREVVNCGGIAEKSPLLMQIYADVCDRPMKISRSSQTCALGAAIFGAVAGGAYPAVQQAQCRMTGVQDTVFRPRRGAVQIYAELYRLYRALHDAFGTHQDTASMFQVMKELIALRRRVRQEAA